MQDALSACVSEDVVPANGVLALASDPTRKQAQTTYCTPDETKQAAGEVTVFEVFLLSIDEDGFVTFLDDQGAQYGHLKLPEPPKETGFCSCRGQRRYEPPKKPLRDELKERHERGEDLTLRVWQMGDSEAIVGVKAAPVVVERGSEEQLNQDQEVATPAAVTAVAAAEREEEEGAGDGNWEMVDGGAFG
mmetsp:Transcript_104799/g.302343  ORF Transcript_104799/g.302343 Transcript_104799/m.302343 type:complete len:190 (-) Transcript_104799:487-1056(-)